jgi:hypothetical protein
MFVPKLKSFEFSDPNDFNLANQLFAVSGKVEKPMCKPAKSCFAKLKSFKFRLFWKFLTPEASFLLSAKLRRVNFPKARKVPCQNQSHFAFSKFHRLKIAAKKR